MSNPRGKLRKWIVWLFTLVVLVVGLIVALEWNDRLEISEDLEVRPHMIEYKTLLLMYQEKDGFLPSTEQGLKSFIIKPTTAPIPANWRQFLDAPLLDHWGQGFFYENPGRHNPAGYDLFSSGPDRQPHTADDIGNW